MSDIDFKSGLNNEIKEFNQALLDSFGGSIAENYRPGDEITADTVSQTIRINLHSSLKR